jgi:hypothetical protein
VAEHRHASTLRNGTSSHASFMSKCIRERTLKYSFCSDRRCRRAEKLSDRQSGAFVRGGMDRGWQSDDFRVAPAGRHRCATPGSRRPTDLRAATRAWEFPSLPLVEVSGRSEWGLCGAGCGAGSFRDRGCHDGRWCGVAEGGFERMS